MALPKIAPYSYREQEHQNRANWRVNPARAALLVHDMQRYSCAPLNWNATDTPPRRPNQHCHCQYSPPY